MNIIVYKLPLSYIKAWPMIVVRNCCTIKIEDTVGPSWIFPDNPGLFNSKIAYISSASAKVEMEIQIANESCWGCLVFEGDGVYSKDLAICIAGQIVSMGGARERWGGHLIEESYWTGMRSTDVQSHEMGQFFKRQFGKRVKFATRWTARDKPTGSSVEPTGFESFSVRDRSWSVQICCGRTLEDKAFAVVRSRRRPFSIARDNELERAVASEFSRSGGHRVSEAK